MDGAYQCNIEADDGKETIGEYVQVFTACMSARCYSAAALLLLQLLNDDDDDDDTHR